MAEEEPAPSLTLDGLASDVLQHVFAQAGAEAGVRLAACSHKLHSEAARCQALWDHVLLHGSRLYGWGAEAAKDWTEVDLDLSGVSIHLPSQGIEFRNKDGTEYHDS